jgi:glycosyltransferase involved in cell wall biosynthesis
LRLAVVVEYFPPRMGSDRRIYELMTRLSAKTQIDFLVIPSFRESTGRVARWRMRVSKGARAHANCSRSARISVQRLELPSIIQRLWTKSFYVAYILSMIILELKTVKQLLKRKPDIVIVNYPSVYTGLLGFLAAKLSRRICVTDFSDLIAQYTIELLGAHNSRFVNNALVFVQNFIVKRSNAVLAVTNYVRNYAIRIGTAPDRVTVVPNGCDLTVFDYNIYENYRKKTVSDSKVCMYCGRVDNWAGSRIIAQVAKKFEDKGDGTSFVIVGNQVQNTFGGRNVVALDEMDQEELPKMMSIADVMIVPFPKNEVSDAASPVKLFEAMAMRKAVVASGVAGIREVINDGLNGMLVEPSDVDEWVEKISGLLGSEKISSQIGEEALETVRKRYQWQQLADKTEKVLRKILVSEKTERLQSDNRLEKTA